MPQAPDAPRPGRFRRALKRAAVVLGLGCVFVSALAGGILLHLDTRPARHVTQQAVNHALAPLFQGQIKCGPITHISLTGVEIQYATAVDPRGDDVINASQLRAEADVLAIARDALWGDGPLVVDIPLIRIEHAIVVVGEGPTGEITIGEAFTLKETPPTEPTKPAEPGRIVRVNMPQVEIGMGNVYGQVAPPRALDADIRRLIGSVFVTENGVTVDVKRTGLQDRTFLPASTQGTANYHLDVVDLPGQVDADIKMSSEFVGSMGKMPVSVSAEMHNGYLKATGDVIGVYPEQIRSFWPDVPLQHRADGHVELAGLAPTFSVVGRLDVHGASGLGEVVAVDGQLDATGPLRIDLGVRVDGLDPRSLVVGAPATRVFAGGNVQVEYDSGQPRMQASVVTGAMFVDGVLIPPLEAHLAYDRGELSTSLWADEAGAHVDGGFVLEKTGDIAFFAHGIATSLRSIPRLSSPIDGGGSMRVQGRYDDRGLSAVIAANFSKMSADGDVSLQSAQVNGKLEGPLNALTVSGQMVGSTLKAGGYAFENVEATIAGPIGRPRVTTTLTDGLDGKMEAAGQINTDSGGIEAVSFKLDRDDAHAQGQIARVNVTGGGVAFDGIEIRGDTLGSIDGKLEVRGGELVGELRGEGIDINKTARLVGYPYPIEGIANVDIDLKPTPGGRTGHVLFELENGGVLIVPGISAHLSARFDGDEIEADGLVRLVANPVDRDVPVNESQAPIPVRVAECQGAIAEVRVSGGKGVLSGPLLSLETWKAATGEVEVAAEEWRLDCLADLVPFGLPVSEVDGTLTTRFRMSRDDVDALPSVSGLFVRTRGLSVSGPSSFGSDPEWSSQKLDVQLKANFNGESGALDSELLLFDGAILADLETDLGIDLEPVKSGRYSIWDAVREAPLEVQLSVPRRAFSQLDTLPTFIAQYLPPVDGEFRLDGYVDGSIDAPFVALTALGFDVSYRPDGDNTSDWVVPLDFETTATYEGKQASLDLTVSHESQRVATVNVQAEQEGDAYPPGKFDDWTGGLYAELSNVPLAEIPFFSDRGIGGHISGTIGLSGLNRHPAMEIDLAATTIELGPEHFADATIKAQIRDVPSATRPTASGDDATLAPSDDEPAAPQPTGDEPAAPPTNALLASADPKSFARFEIAIEPPGGGEEGSLKLQGYGGVVWLERLIPTIDYASPADLSAVTHNFSLVALSPLVAEHLSRIDGIVNGAVRIGWGRLEDESKGKIQAELRVQSGVAHIPQLGQEFRNAQFKIISNPDGVIRIENFDAEGMSGEISGRGLLRMDGLRMTSGYAILSVPEDRRIPITLEGVPLGRAYGDIVLDAQMRKEGLFVVARVPYLALRLPASSSRDVQRLDEHPDFVVMQPLGPPEEARDSKALAIQLTGEIEEVFVEGSGFELSLRSGDRKPVVTITDKARVSGDIELTSGYFEILSKRFTIERGLVRLQPADAANPYLNVTAYWDPPGGGRVYVDYVGLLHPITDDKLKFRSNPPRTRQAILAAVLFGSDLLAPEGEQQGGAAGGLAAGVGGEIAAGQFNALLSGINGLSSRIGTTDDGTLKPALVYERGDTVTTLSSYTTSTGNAGTADANTTATQSEAGGETRAEMSVDWRLHQNWTLRSKFGVGAGGTSSGVDLLWQYRY